MAIMLQPCRFILKRIFVTNGLDSVPMQNGVFLQPSRGIRPRKPYLLGLAKSKWFIVNERPHYTEEELVEVRRMKKAYSTQIKSLQEFFRQENIRRAEGSKVALDEIKAEEEEWQRSMLLNEEWNKQVAALREERLAEERKIKQQEVLQALLDQQEKQKKLKEEIDELVRKEKERSKSYITAENIDEAIAQAMQHTVDFNFAIDLKGNIYKGRHTKPKVEETVENENDISIPPLPPIPTEISPN